MQRSLASLAAMVLLGSAALAAEAPVTTADLSYAPTTLDRPQPPRAEPVSAEDLRARAQAPEGAIILFDGHGLDAWNNLTWKATEDYFEIVPTTEKAKKVNLTTREGFGSCRVHLEWWTPPGLPAEISGQNRSNSGVFLMGRYEVQVLDSYDITTYPDGIAGAIYGQFPPLANSLRPAGEWQYYDIEFHRPLFDAQGHVTHPARMTVDLNGIRVQENVQLTGPTGHKIRPPYVAHADKLPLALQDHANLVRYRNIWLIPLP